MVTYADSSFIVSLFVKDGNSAPASSFLVRNPNPVSMTNFSKGEAQHAIRTMVFKQQIAVDEMARALLQLEEDEANGFVRLAPLDPDTLFRQAAQLSNRYAQDTGVRYLDMLHVASAQLLKAERFLTFDIRQRKLAEAVGLNVKI